MLHLFVAFALAALVSNDPSPRFWGALDPGAHRVGFELVDGSSAPGSAGWTPRPIVVAVWYPALRDDSAARMTFGDYFAAAEDLRRRSASLSIAISGDASALSSEIEETIRATPMYAQRGAQRATGDFPIVLFSARYGTTAAQSVVAEYLASRGFVVAAVRPKDAQEKLPFELKTADEKLEELDAQTDDLRGALRIIRALPSTRDEPSAVIAWSYSGESAWRLSLSDSRITLVIGLDTNVRDNWVYQAATKQTSIGDAPAFTRYVDLQKGAGEFAGMAHGNFNALEGMIPAVLGIARVQPWSKDGPEAKAGYERLARRVASELAMLTSRKTSPAFETVEFEARDGARVTADFYRAAESLRPCVALFHQSGSSRGEYRTIGRALASMGHSAIAADIRWGDRDRWNDVVNENAARHGTAAAFQGGDRARVAAIKAGEHHDLDATIDWLKRKGGCRGGVVAWGSSIQANGVLELAARRRGEIAAIIDVSPGEYDRERPDRMKSVARTVEQPSLVIWGRNEDTLSQPIFDALGGAKTSYRSSGRHGNAVFFEDVETWTRLRQFLLSIAPERDHPSATAPPELDSSLVE